VECWTFPLDISPSGYLHPNPNHKPYPNTNPDPTEPTLTLQFITLTQTEQGWGNCLGEGTFRIPVV